MHNCPHCQQPFNDNSFAFYCPCCQRPVGELRVEGHMLGIWWLDASGAPATIWGVRTLKRGADYLNLIDVSPLRPSTKPGETRIRFTVTAAPTGGDQPKAAPLPFIEQRGAVEVFAELLKPDTQEWQIL